MPASCVALRPLLLLLLLLLRGNSGASLVGGAASGAGAGGSAPARSALADAEQQRWLSQLLAAERERERGVASPLLGGSKLAWRRGRREPASSHASLARAAEAAPAWREADSAGTGGASTGGDGDGLTEAAAAIAAAQLRHGGTDDAAFSSRAAAARAF